MFKFPLALLRWLYIGFVLVTLLSLLAPFISPNDFWPTIFVSLSFPYQILLHFCFLFFWLFLKKWTFFLSLAVLIGTYGASSKHFGTNLFSSPDKEAKCRVLSYNVAGFAHLRPAKKERETLLNSIKMLKKIEPEVLCFQEFYRSKGFQKVATDAFKKAGYQNQHITTYFGPAIFSKYPITKHGFIKFKGTKNSCAWADIKIKGQTIRFYAAHLQSNKVSATTTDVLNSLNLDERKTWQKIRGIGAGIRRNTWLRTKQAKEIAKHIQDSPHPVVLCGDLNDTPMSYVYQTISQGLDDHFQQNAFGSGATYDSKIPFLKIDYIFSSPEIEATYHQIHPTTFSDHYAVWSDINF